MSEKRDGMARNLTLTAAAKGRSPMKRVMFIILAVVTIAYLGLCAALFIFQRDLLFSPPPKSGRSVLGTVVVARATERVLASVKPHAGRDAVMYLGGNGEDVSYKPADTRKGVPGSRALPVALPGLRRQFRRAFRSRSF